MIKTMTKGYGESTITRTSSGGVVRFPAKVRHPGYKKSDYCTRIVLKHAKDIFNLKYIICPVNEGNVHWVSAVIFMEEKKLQWFDSMGGTDMYRLNGLLRYLKDEWNAKKKGQGEFNEDEWELVRCTADTPRQSNGYDCGVFTCMICDFISKDQPLLFNQSHIHQCRDRIALSIMKNCAIE